MSSNPSAPSLILVAACALAALDVQSYIRPGPIGVPPSNQCSGSEFPVHCLVGERIMILPQRRSLQEFGYQMIQAENDSPHPRSLTHDEGAGKTGVIQSVIVNEVGHAKVRAAMDGGEVFLLNAYGYGAPVFDGIVFLRDIDDARKSFLGKHLWTNGNYIYTLDGEDETSLLEVRRFSRLKVVDVVAGWSAEEPIRFVLETDDGREGFLDTRTSERNSPGLDGRRNEFARKLLTSDPKSANKWPDDIWLLIERGQIENGMTRDQVLMSRGAPDEVNETRIGDAVHEQWVYGDDLFIYLENDVVTALQQ